MTGLEMGKNRPQHCMVRDAVALREKLSIYY
jgi:hypothetical protein